MKTTDGLTRRFPLRKERTVIGREMRSDVRIAVPSVAPQHCEIVFSDQELRLTDLDSPHGIRHNGQAVRQARLRNTDKLTVGPITFTVEVGERSAPDGSPPTIETHRVSGHPSRSSAGPASTSSRSSRTAASAARRSIAESRPQAS
jgi:pSer/pThr/pTyr-binding forkhead associated (FHA) protein